MELYQQDIKGLHQLIKNREVSCYQVCRAVAERIQTVENKIGAYHTLLLEPALAYSRQIDHQLSQGAEAGYLTGIPIAIKDVICTKGVPTTCSSRILANFVPPYDATVIEMLKAEGMVLLGKTNMDEFAMGSSTENSAYKLTHNPWNLEHIPGGSSGGSAAAVAADEAVAALGSDTGGSIRQPAACCGVVGIKPTYGRVSRYGLVAFASSLDQIGPLTKTVYDAALMLKIISGKDSRDSTSVEQPVPDYIAELDKPLGKPRVGIPREYFAEGLHPEVKERVQDALRVMEKLGAEVVEVSLPHTEYAIATYYLVATAEASSNLARYDGVRYGHRAQQYKTLEEMYVNSRSQGFGPEVKRRIMLGTYALSAGYYDAYYLKALKVRTLLKGDFDAAFKQVELICTPTMPTPPFRLGEKIDDPLEMYLSDIYTVTVNLAGLPAMSIPCGFSESHLPIGLQIIGPPFEEGRILRLAHAYEQEAGHFRTNPPL